MTLQVSAVSATDFIEKFDPSGRRNSRDGAVSVAGSPSYNADAIAAREFVKRVLPIVLQTTATLQFDKCFYCFSPTQPQDGYFGGAPEIYSSPAGRVQLPRLGTELRQVFTDIFHRSPTKADAITFYINWAQPK